ncbi:hypothetical protein BDR06DRAFT_969859 [Suillus hirtellus]|nr:hypothetical protein BDR06DRAFT_969859 [Suillus hirtellus]
MRHLRLPAEKKEKQQKEPEVTTQAIIEATVPKIHMERQEKLTHEAQDTYILKTNGHSTKPIVTAREVSDQDKSPTKKQKTAKPTPVVLSVEEAEGVEMVQHKSSVFTWPAEIVIKDTPLSLTTPSPTPFLHTPSLALPMKTAFGAKPMSEVPTTEFIHCQEIMN